MAHNNLATAQPDFNLLSQSFHLAGQEIQKISNVPAISNGQEILSEIQAMRRETTERFNQVDQRFNEFDQRFNEFDQRIRASQEMLLNDIQIRYVSR